MKYMPTIIIVYASLISMFIHSMDIEDTCVSQTITHAAFISNDTAAFAGNNNLLALNFSTQKRTYLLERCTVQDLCVNKARTKLAVSSNDGIITVYDTKTKESVWKYDTDKTPYVPIVFNSQNNDQLYALLRGPSMTILCLEGGKIKQQRKACVIKPTTSVVCHPQNSSIIYPSYVYFDSEAIVIAFNNVHTMLSHHETESPSYISCHISNDAKHLLINIDHTSWQLWQYNKLIGDSTQPDNVFDIIKDVSCLTAQFHPDYPLIAALYGKKIEEHHALFLAYYSYKNNTPQLLQEICLVPDYAMPTILSPEKHLDFSPDGKKLLVASHYQYFIRNAIADCICTQENKKILLPLSWTLKNNQLGLIIPNEIIGIIMHLFFELLLI